MEPQAEWGSGFQTTSPLHFYMIMNVNPPTTTIWRQSCAAVSGLGEFSLTIGTRLVGLGHVTWPPPPPPLPVPPSPRAPPGPPTHTHLPQQALPLQQRVYEEAAEAVQSPRQRGRRHAEVVAGVCHACRGAGAGAGPGAGAGGNRRAAVFGGTGSSLPAPKGVYCLTHAHAHSHTKPRSHTDAHGQILFVFLELIKTHRHRHIHSHSRSHTWRTGGCVAAAAVLAEEVLVVLLIRVAPTALRTGTGEVGDGGGNGGGRGWERGGSRAGKGGGCRCSCTGM